MEIASIILGIILIVVCIVPFVISYNSKINRNKAMKKLLTDLADQYNCTINTHEFSGGVAIGIDTSNRIVFFSRKTKHGVDSTYVNLSDFQNCKVVNTGRTINFKDGKFNVIDKLELSFIPLEKFSSPVNLEFYNSEINMQLNGELQSVEKWAGIINQYLK